MIDAATDDAALASNISTVSAPGVNGICAREGSNFVIVLQVVNGALIRILKENYDIVSEMRACEYTERYGDISKERERERERENERLNETER
jgi:hypothetical protein